MRTSGASTCARAAPACAPGGSVVCTRSATYARAARLYANRSAWDPPASERPRVHERRQRANDPTCARTTRAHERPHARTAPCTNGPARTSGASARTTPPARERLRVCANGSACARTAPRVRERPRVCTSDPAHERPCVHERPTRATTRTRARTDPPGREQLSVCEPSHRVRVASRAPATRTVGSRAAGTGSPPRTASPPRTGSRVEPGAQRDRVARRVHLDVVVEVDEAVPPAGPPAAQPLRPAVQRVRGVAADVQLVGPV